MESIRIDLQHPFPLNQKKKKFPKHKKLNNKFIFLQVIFYIYFVIINISFFKKKIPGHSYYVGSLLLQIRNKKKMDIICFYLRIQQYN
jgi:hypothetical protein